MRIQKFVALFVFLLMPSLVAAQFKPVAAPIPSFKEVTGPGSLFPALQRLPADEDLAHFNYIVKEFFVSGTAQGKSGVGPLEGLPMRKMILMGTSASAALLTAYLPAHLSYRTAGLQPIFDGFLPTSIGGESPIMKVDVPLILMPTMTEIVAGAATGNRYRRPDGDTIGDQFRIYEVAGLAHNDSRINPVYDPDPCKYPVSRFPQGMGLSAGLERLIQWVDKGKVPPRATYVVVDNDLKNDGSVLALDANGNPKGGVRNTYVDVPVNRYVSPNETKLPPISNPSPLTAAASVELFCSIAGYEMPLNPQQLKALYKSKKDYQSKVEQRANQLIKEGWLSPAYKDLILGDAAKVTLP